MAGALERRGRRWLVWSFLACPCHLPWTLALLGSMLGGTVLGGLLREHTVVAGLLVASTWLAGTGRGFWLVRKGQRGELVCAVPPSPGSPGAGHIRLRASRWVRGERRSIRDST